MMFSHPFHQVAYVVQDLDAAVRHWSDVLGVGPWTIWTMGPDVLEDSVYDGRPAEFGIRHALAWSGPLQFEIVEPLQGPSLFADQLEANGPGLSHVGVLVEDHEAATKEIVSQGYRPLQSARFGQSRDGRFAYFGSPRGDSVVELILPPSVRYPADATYPEQES